VRVSSVPQAGPAGVGPSDTEYDIAINQLHETIRQLDAREAQRASRRSAMLRRYREINPSAADAYEIEAEASWLVLSEARDRADPDQTRRVRLGQESHNRWRSLRSIPLQIDTQAWGTQNNIPGATPVRRSRIIGGPGMGEWGLRPEASVSRGPGFVNPPFIKFTTTVVTNPAPSRDRNI
jgi:hypothetical protein